MANLGVPLFLREIALQCKNSEYNTNIINAVIMRKKEPNSCSYFQFRNYNTSRALDKEKLKEVAKIFAKQIKNLGYNVKFCHF